MPIPTKDYCRNGTDRPARFAAFRVIDTSYKQIGRHSICVSILVPKFIRAGKRPLIVRWHGGYLVSGSRLLPEWFPKWLLEYAVARGAIILSPDYRLLPEATGQDILNDMRDFWKWVQRTLTHVLPRTSGPRRIAPDLTNILCTGESAGGYLAIQSLLHLCRQALFPSLDRLYKPIVMRALILGFPSLDLRSPWFSKAGPKSIMNSEPWGDVKILQEHMLNLPHGEVVTSDPTRKRIELARIIIQHGQMTRLLGNRTELFPLECLGILQMFLNQAPNGRHPFIWIYHGDKDTAVPFDGTKRFVSQIHHEVPQVQIKLSIGQGMEHGYDTALGMDEGWVRQGLQIIDRYWGGDG
ncbi:alpha/beta-hydrolase [Eremomyces bilateralis CBS 781.70]|uniref:Alpha/beta-hydrolase n=1 Tax=Eremomyces bilateralis CBS 781.70 TaxID=1392243 RepID=A0A6G1G1F1_9PEZI|nr:alpha/beta-hydrolase [Eremomyces bilateralis CBS 781.70]KAF1811937.1 alpha/beta-hydrolase [Eremomyces bilateralis CBS 781.70]